MMNKQFNIDAQEALDFLISKGGDKNLTVEQWMLNVFGDRVYHVLKIKRLNGIEEVENDVHGDAKPS